MKNSFFNCLEFMSMTEEKLTRHHHNSDSAQYGHPWLLDDVIQNFKKINNTFDNTKLLQQLQKFWKLKKG